ncbi:hypothetical protein [Serratia proteamaculans]|uniref:hypothetical protein n=1 Tax=Serratia proteamaculans TaxID=28151 RepID=UPI003CF01731
MKLFEVMLGNFSLYLVARNEVHAKRQLDAMMHTCFSQQVHPWVTGAVLCEAGNADISSFYH